MATIEDRIEKGISTLEAQLELWTAKLDEARAAGGDKWETLKEGMERAWQDLEAAFKKVIN